MARHERRAAAQRERREAPRREETKPAQRDRASHSVATLMERVAVSQNLTVGARAAPMPEAVVADGKKYFVADVDAHLDTD